jgi:hypothetical protein
VTAGHHSVGVPAAVDIRSSGRLAAVPTGRGAGLDERLGRVHGV